MNHSFSPGTVPPMQTEYNYQGKAMGTDFSIAIVSNTREIADTLSRETTEKIHAYETRFSRFQPQSELSILNTKKSAVVSDEFFAAMQEAHRLFVLTRGIFNPLVQIERFGYNKTFETLKEHEEEHTDEPYDIDFSTTVIDAVTHTVTLREGQKLDFGGFLKGYLATQLCLEIMRHEGVTGAIVNIGGDLHTEGLDAHNKEFSFEIGNPITQKDDVTVVVHNSSLATSGTYKRTWKYKDTFTHHILDATGTHNPHTDIVSASIIHKKGGDAEAYAKVFLSIGSTEAQKMLNDSDTQYVLIDNNGNIESHIL